MVGGIRELPLPKRVKWPILRIFGRGQDMDKPRAIEDEDEGGEM